MSCFTKTVSVTFFLSLFSFTALAQTYPDRPVKMIIPYAPGGATDQTGRAVANELTRIWGQLVVLEHRPGASTWIGAEAAARAAPDGHTLLYSDNSTFVINPHLFSKMPIDPLRDLEHIALVMSLSPVLVVNTGLPVNNIAELLTHARANPGKLSYASVGPGSSPHLAMEYFNKLAGLSMLHVPYKGTAPALTDLLGGRVNFLVATLSIMEQHEKAGGLRVLASATDRRPSTRPGLPTIGETLKGYAITSWYGLAAPKGTPAPLLDKINTDALAAVLDPKFRSSYMAPQALEPGSGSRQEFLERVKADFALWQGIVKLSGAKLD